MADEQLKPPCSLALTAESAGLLFVVALVMMLWPPYVAPEVFASANRVERVEPHGEAIPLSAVERPGEIASLRWRISRALPTDTPIALQMAGPFSAQVYWNGSLIGEKGVPGQDAASERAGPIDFLASIPTDAIRTGHNEVVLVFSSHRAGYEPSSIIQSLSVVPFRPDERRALRYYGALILTSGTLIALMGAVLYWSRERAYPNGLWIAASLAGLLIAGGAEMSRSLINYPYDWHQIRQAVQFLGLLMAGVALSQYVRQRWPQAAWPGPVYLGGDRFCRARRLFDSDRL